MPETGTCVDGWGGIRLISGSLNANETLVYMSYVLLQAEASSVRILSFLHDLPEVILFSLPPLSSHHGCDLMHLCFSPPNQTLSALTSKFLVVSVPSNTLKDMWCSFQSRTAVNIADF